MSRTTSPPREDDAGGGGLVDYRNVQRVVGGVRAGDRMSLPRAVLILAVGTLAIAAVAVLVAVASSAGSGWVEIARDPGDAWDAAARDEADGTGFRLRGTGFFDRSTVVVADPAPGDSVRGALRTVDDHAVVLGVAAPHVAEVRVLGGETAPAGAQPIIVDVPLGQRAFAVGLDAAVSPEDVRLEGLDRNGEPLGRWRPALPDEDADGS